MLPNWSGVSMAAFSLPRYQRKTHRSHFILLHWTFCFARFTSFWFSPLFFLSLLPGCPPEALHYPSTWPHAHARCPLPYFPHSSTFPCKSASAGSYLPYASRHFCQHNFWKFCWCFHLVTQLICSPHEFPVSYLSWSHLWAWREKKWLLQGTGASVFSWSSSTQL